MNRLHQSGDWVEGRYYIEDYHDEGGMQQVYKAYDRRLERQVALKTPKNQSASTRFQQSAICSAKVIHPNVARTLDYFQSNGREYLIEEFIEGRDLNDVFISHYNYLDPCAVAHIGHLMVRAILASHRANVIHRDLKPSNIMVLGGEYLRDIKITDFGIAKMVDDELALLSDEDSHSSIAGSKTLVGAMPYMAPEVVLQQAPVGKYSDIWSMGAVLYHLLAGAPPFSTQFANIIINYHSKMKAADIAHLNSLSHLKMLSQQLVTIIECCLDYDFRRRPSAEELLSQFSRLCYPIANRTIGSVYYPKEHRAWGFIQSQGDDAFFHRDEVYGDGLNSGDTVLFASYPGYPNPRAFPTIKMK